MTATTPAPDLAHRVADRLRVEGPWEVLGERSRKFEVHLQGTSVELERGPIAVEGYGLRLFRRATDGMGVGFQASTDFSTEGVAAVLRDAEMTARYSRFPASSVELPARGQPAAQVPVVDPKLWDDPAGALREYVSIVLAAFGGRPRVVPTFGSVRATLTEVSLANSSGLQLTFPETRVDLELGVKAFGGPEGAPPGEFWVTRQGRRLEPELVSGSVDDWCGYAADVRRAVSPPSGDQAVVLPTEVLAGILPDVLGFRFTGRARLRKLAPEPGTTVAPPHVNIRDEGDYPWGPGSGPYDDEGTPRQRHPLLQQGAVAGLLYDSLYASVFSSPPTGCAERSGYEVGAFRAWADLRFPHRPVGRESTLVVAPGDGGTTEELVEAAREGILVTQLGWARPEPYAGTFGGEIRIGYRIRGGKLAEPIRGGTVGGSVLGPPGSPSLLANTEAIGRKVELCHHLASPAFLVRPLSVAGSTA